MLGRTNASIDSGEKRIVEEITEDKTLGIFLIYHTNNFARNFKMVLHSEKIGKIKGLDSKTIP